jgi:hypothetical protein
MMTWCDRYPGCGCGTQSGPHACEGDKPAADKPAADLFGAAKVDKKTGALFYESKTVEWWTPRRYIDMAVEVMGDIDLDPASCAAANSIIGATSFYDSGGELKDWRGRIWLNPPYGKQTKLFVNRLLYEHRLKHVKQAIVLLNVITLDRGIPDLLPLWAHQIHVARC